MNTMEILRKYELRYIPRLDGLRFSDVLQQEELWDEVEDARSRLSGRDGWVNEIGRKQHIRMRHRKDQVFWTSKKTREVFLSRWGG